jgi:hypothetical protein
MGSLPFAFSVHHFISSVGADAGFASIIGLAVLILLYFAQARETATLRDHAYEAASRIQQLEARLAQQPRGQQVPGQPGQATPAPGQPAQSSPTPGASGQGQGAAAPSKPAPAPAPAPSRMGGAPTAPAATAAPAGVGAPALAAATRLIPSASPAGALALAPERTESGSEADVGAGEDARPGEAGGITTVEPAPAESRESERQTGPPPATVAGAANGSAREGAAPRPVSAPVAAAATAPPRSPVRPPGATSARRPPVTPPRSRPPQGGGGDGLPRVVVGLLAALGLAAIIVLLLILTSGGGSSSSTSATATTNLQTTRHGRKAQVNPSSVTVAVLNGTATNGLARRVATKLGSAGYKQGMVATASDQTRTTTVVAFLPGFKRDALSVAAALKSGPSSVQPIDQSTQAVACPPPATCTANVVVTLGSDLASTQ